jgi:hypothetical protein
MAGILSSTAVIASSSTSASPSLVANVPQNTKSKSRKPKVIRSAKGTHCPHYSLWVSNDTL